MGKATGMAGWGMVLVGEFVVLNEGAKKKGKV
jgi:hypothetical protein